jgi:hypothetical protein
MGHSAPLREEKVMMKRWEVLLTYRSPSKKACIAWLVMAICTIGAALLAVMIAAQGASAHDNHEPSAGWFQRCSLAKIGSFDPLVYPGTPPPVGHRHLFFGSKDINYDSTPSDLLAGTSGTTCFFEAGTNAATEFPDWGANGGNFSGYWIPDLKLRNGTWASGAQINAYYKKGASSLDAHVIKPFPAGLKMLIRDRNNSRTDVRWFCSGLSGEGNNGKFTERPYDCDPTTVYKYVTARITFPQCGNGRLDSTDHISHMAYAGDNGCPSTHPHVFPRLFITAKYNTSYGAGSVLAGGEDPATGFHADYFEAWQPGTLEFFVDRCIRGGINCRDGDRLPS